MERKQKVIVWQIIIGVALVLCFGGYFCYFFFKDILHQPQNYDNTRNLFIEKAEIDIEKIKNTTIFSLCAKRRDTVYYSLLEDKINGFLSTNANENEKEYNQLDKKSIFVFIEQFITLANQYFERPTWNENTYVKDLVRWIKGTKFVESNSPNWNTLSGFENAIDCYNEMVNCTSQINSMNFRLPHNIPNYKYFSNIKNRQNNLLKRDCKKNSDAVNNLSNSYNNLNTQLSDIIKTKIKEYNNEFVNQYDNGTATEKKLAKDKAKERYNEMETWKDIYEIKDILDNFYKNIYD